MALYRMVRGLYGRQEGPRNVVTYSATDVDPAKRVVELSDAEAAALGDRVEKIEHIIEKTEQPNDWSFVSDTTADALADTIHTMTDVEHLDDMRIYENANKARVTVLRMIDTRLAELGYTAE